MQEDGGCPALRWAGIGEGFPPPGSTPRTLEKLRLGEASGGGSPSPKMGAYFRMIMIDVM